MVTRVKVGDKFNHLEVISLSEERRQSGTKRHLAYCKCDCGRFTTVEKYNLVTGNTRRCNNCSRANKSLLKRTHGNSDCFKRRNPLGYKCYVAHQRIKDRCNDPKNKRYKDYGARGVSVCQRWMDSYESFRADMGLPPSKSHQIDRIDNDGDYSPDNCRWVTHQENSNNKRNNHFVTANGKTQTLAQWERETGIKQELIRHRIEGGWSDEQAVNTPLNSTRRKHHYITPAGEFGTLVEAAKAHGMSVSGIAGRFKSTDKPEWRRL